jgi:hypothetical protein
MSPNSLTAAVEQQIVASIRAGCYAHVAAEAAGISREDFLARLKQGQAGNAPASLDDFVAEVRTAQAQARFRAEILAYQQDPLAWLEHGPGREMPRDPGWSGPVRPHDMSVHEFNPLAHPEVMQILNYFLSALEKHPDAHVDMSLKFESLFGTTRAPTLKTQGEGHDPPLPPLAPAA